MSYLFVFRAYPDVDHMVPLAWRLLEDGEEVHAIVSPGLDASADHHLDHIAGYSNLHLKQIEPKGGGRLARIGAHLRSTLPYALGYVLRHRVQLVAVEWGYGLPDGYDRLASPRGLVALARSLAGSILHGGDPRQVRNSFVVAARVLGRARVCLPHGLNVKLDAITTNESLASGRNGFDWRDRNRFSAYVLNTASHREFFLDHAAGDPEVMQVWGSLRWAPEWVEVNRRLAPTFEWPEDGRDRLKVTLMVPKWRNRVNKEEAVALVKRLQALDFVSLALKHHPRPQATDPLREDPDVDWKRIHDVTKVDSVSLIDASDVVIDVGSSIGVEVLMQGKVLLNPHYCHQLTTIFDEVPGSCVVAESEEAVVSYLESHAAGNPHVVPPDAHAEILRRTVFASSDEPFDVLGLYSERVRALATAG
ncbi:MAG: hypothetical protein ACJ77M_00645 [Thermoleophilaceae bacterium]